jgi:flavin reductase (DIM6/NTAB) family NADH-FMN oxidoreductase RutF
VSLNPPLVLWSLGMFSQGLTTFQNASHFTVNILGASQRALASQFAKSSGDKFAGVNWTPGLGNAPVLADSVANFQCRAANRYYGGDHIIFLGAVEATPTTIRSHCCLRAAASASSLPAMARNRRDPNLNSGFYRSAEFAKRRQDLYFFPISARYQSPISLAVINATPSWPRT